MQHVSGAAGDTTGVDEVVSALSAVTLSSDRLRWELAKRLQLSALDLRALYTIAAGDEVTPKHLAAALDLTSGSITTLLDRVENKGFVERLAHPQDRRSLIVRLTPAGNSAHAWAGQGYKQAGTAGLGGIENVDLTSLTSFLAAAERSLREVGESLPPAPPQLQAPGARSI